MDTQGVFDNESTLQDCASIFALSNLISSVQIYNLMQQLQEDDLQHLEFFTEFGKLVSEQADKTGVSNSRLIFLIRDWGCPYEYPYGKDGGEAYIRKKLKIKSNHHEELKRIRRNLSRCFPNIGGFLLPHPGKAVVTKQTYDGTVKEMDDDFVEMVKLLVPYILSRDMMMTKRINGMEVTGEDMSKYVRAFVKLLKNGEFPCPQTAFKATVAVGRQLAINAAYKFYKEGMEKASSNGKDSDVGPSMAVIIMLDRDSIFNELRRSVLMRFCLEKPLSQSIVDRGRTNSLLPKYPTTEYTELCLKLN
ncbi:atlastin-1 [Magallana gigas]|uniref:atlastin-1 n=1 Tax=Magallana gigas TaxID=29159 RepID=UPI003342DCCC